MTNTHLDYLSIKAILSAVMACATMCSAAMDHCYLRSGAAQRCLPPFVNAAFGKTVIASDTCGTPPEQYCLQTGATGVTKSCHSCNSEVPSLAHGPEFLTDFNNQQIPTWWQSRTMIHSVQYPNMVNLTLNLNKAFDITYVRLLFRTSRPESFAIYKKKCEECDWQPMQYYSGSCFTTYGIDNKEIVTVENEQKALCTDDFSDISPLTGGNVAFSTLESRPNAYNYGKSPILQDWVKAVAIRITLNRINTFGDEVFRDPKILKSYYYGISDLSIGGRCTCNGHSSECYVGPNDKLQCRCEHNTAGRDCERCAPLFNDRPWSRATRESASECKECDCNGKAVSCFFDMDLYQQTGSGGHCVDCRNNTDGPNCAYCKTNYFRDSSGYCVSCECNAIGSFSQQCGSDGLCFCKPGVGGERCDRCLDDFYNLNEAGCRACECSEAGTVPETVCNPSTGACECKLNVEGRTCDICKPATMNLKESDPYGCTSCFCHGHSSVCDVSPDYTVAYIVSEFLDGKDGWGGRNLLGHTEPLYYSDGSIGMDPSASQPTYFSAPHKFLGQQRFSYNQFLEFDLRVVEAVGSVEYGSGADENSIQVLTPLEEDLILEGDGFRVAASITNQGNPVPNEVFQTYRLRLHEAAGFYPRLSPIEFQRILNNLKRIYISSSYGRDSIAYLDNVQLTTAERKGRGSPADWVERCDSDGYFGNFSEMCAPGYTRDPPNGGVYAPCVPCNCNGHSATCDPDNGVCVCTHHTTGENCELCADGYYFGGDESKRGTPLECQPCPCPEQSACAVLEDGSVVCTNCPAGHAGPQCEICMDGWFGEPRGRGPCLRCMCNGNIDPNAVMNCNRTTGECLKCIHNTTGVHCDTCMPGYFGRAVTDNPEERCRLCECNSLGSQHITACNALSGQCQCQPFVEGRRCDRCRSGYWNLHSGDGCQPCNCHPIGSGTGECDQETGNCDCLPGVTGERCDRCQPLHYRLSREGCSACDCNPDGTENLQCDEEGRCVCKEGVLGDKCDQCQENFYDLVNGCRECPTCYSLVQDTVQVHREELERFENLIENVGDRPLPNDSQSNIEFRKKLSSLNQTVHQLLQLAEEKQREEDGLFRRLEEYSDRLQDVIMKLAGTENNIDRCNETVQDAAAANTESKAEAKKANSILVIVDRKLKEAMSDLLLAQRTAEDSLNKENNMSKMAHEAQELARSHKKASGEIVETAQNAFDKTRKAMDSIQEAIELMDTLMSSLEELIESENKIPSARKLREDLIPQTAKVKKNAKEAKMQSTDLYTAASKLVVPEVDTEYLDTRSQGALSASEELIPRLNELDEEYRRNYGELQTEAYKAQDTLDVAVAAQNTADKLLSQADVLRTAARQAVARGNDSYNDVMETLASLKSFDELINGNREAARKALANSEAIQAKIDEAVATTADAKSALGAARVVALDARDKASQAVAIADQAQADAEVIRASAVESHSRAYEVSEEVSTLSDNLIDVNAQLTDAERQMSQDQQTVNAATQTASQARATARNAVERVDHVLRQLRQLLRRLNNIQDVDSDEIGRLEVLYEDLRREVEEENIDSTLSRLRRDVSRQRRFIRQSFGKIRELRADVQNLKEIAATLPKECANPAVNEQP